MKLSKLMVWRAEAMACSIAGKICAPLTRVWQRLPSTIGGPSKVPISYSNCGSPQP
jgi:hypothetical protein